MNPIEARLLNGRCYFGPFDKDNDLNPDTKRSGLNYFRFNLIGYLLHLLGIAPQKIHYVDGDKKRVVYLHPASYRAWKERHVKNEELDATTLNDQEKTKKFENVIRIICNNYSLTKMIGMTEKQLIKKAEVEFANKPYKDKIIENIKNYLRDYKHSGFIEFYDNRVYIDQEVQEAFVAAKEFFRRDGLNRIPQSCAESVIQQNS